MPNVDDDAKKFEMARAGWFGDAVSWRRRALNMTASELSRRTAELGYPISRGAIAKIESNLRSGKVDVAEVLVLASALDIPPVLLLFPQFSTEGNGAVLPGLNASEDDAVRWVSGQISKPNPYEFDCEASDNSSVAYYRLAPENDGVNLVKSVSAIEEVLEERNALIRYADRAVPDSDDAELARLLLERNREKMEQLRQQVSSAREALWGTQAMFDDSGAETNG